MALNTLDSRLSYRVSRSKSAVFTLKDFSDLSDRDQIGRALRKMVAGGKMVKIGYGLYAKARRSSLTNAVIPVRGLPELAREAVEKLGGEVRPTAAEKAYNSGASTQVPTGRVIGVKGRISRKVSYGGQSIAFEQSP